MLIPIQEGDEKNSEYSEARTRANKRTYNLIIFDNNWIKYLIQFIIWDEVYSIDRDLVNPMIRPRFAG